MSEMRKAIEMTSSMTSGFLKICRFFSWGIVVLGVIAIISGITSPIPVVGFAIGIPTILIGMLALYGSKYAAKFIQTAKAVHSESAEIYEAQLRQARSQKSE